MWIKRPTLLLENLTAGPGSIPFPLLNRCWADEYLVTGTRTNEACRRPVTVCKIGLCPDCSAAICSTTCTCKQAG